MSEIDIYNSLPINSEKSANSVLNVLIIILLNENKTEMKKDILQLAQSTYFSVLVTSGRLFCPEKYKQAQNLFKQNDPFDCPNYHLPITQVHLALSLFPDCFLIRFHHYDKFKLSFFIFTVYQLIVLDSSNIKILITDSTLSSFYNHFLCFYLKKQSFILSYFLNTFPKKQFKSKNIIKIKDIYFNKKDYLSLDSSLSENTNSFIYFVENQKENESQDDDELKSILKFIFDKNLDHQNQADIFDFDIIHEQVPNGIFPTYEDAFNFLTSKPESINMDTLIDDSLHYPSLVPEIANIFMTQLKQRDYETAVKIASQLFKKIDDIRITWIEDFVFIPIMYELYECLNEIDDDKQFEVLFFLFISFYEGCTRQGDEDIENALNKFISKMDEPFRLFLSNLLNHDHEILICESDNNENKPIKRLTNFLNECKVNNDFNADVINQYPYLFFSAFIWGIKTTHPNSAKLISMKIPDYIIMRRFLLYLSSNHQNKGIESTNLIYTIRTFECSFDFLTRFPLLDESAIRMVILQHLKDIANPYTELIKFQGIIICWRAWIHLYSIERFVIVLLETLIWDCQDIFNQEKARNNFMIAERILANVFLNSSKSKICFSVDNLIEFNEETNQFVKIDDFNSLKFDFSNVKIDNNLKRALWTALEFVKNYDGPYYDGVGLASFCLLLNISITNDWKSEFKKALLFCCDMMKESSWKSLKYSFCGNFLHISLSLIDVNDLIDIEMLDLDFLQMDWKFGINFFYIQSEIKRLKELKIISFD